MTHTSTGARLAQSTGGTLADLIPFNGLVYAESLKGSIGDLTTPPYDIISKEAQKAFYEKNPNNVIRLELPMAPDPETPESNRYTRARADLDRMLSSGVLTVDSAPALYPYTMTFKDPLTGNSRRIQGFVGRIRLEEWEKKIVYPHERTLQGPKEDRMALFKATSCSFSQIYLLYPDATREVIGLLAPKSVERFRCTDSDNVLHELGAVTDAATLARVTEIFRKKSLYIADGHHRYETYLAYRNYRRSLETSPNPNAPYEFVTVFLAAMEDENLSVLPTHRLVKSIPGGGQNLSSGARFPSLHRALFQGSGRSLSRRPSRLQSPGNRHRRCRFRDGRTSSLSAQRPARRRRQGPRHLLASGGGPFAASGNYSRTHSHRRSSSV